MSLATLDRDAERAYLNCEWGELALRRQGWTGERVRGGNVVHVYDPRYLRERERLQSHASLISLPDFKTIRKET